jgi:hypothetical protein
MLVWVFAPVLLFFLLLLLSLGAVSAAMITLARHLQSMRDRKAK